MSTDDLGRRATAPPRLSHAARLPLSLSFRSSQLAGSGDGGSRGIFVRRRQHGRKLPKVPAIVQGLEIPRWRSETIQNYVDDTRYDLCCFCLDVHCVELRAIYDIFKKEWLACENGIDAIEVVGADKAALDCANEGVFIHPPASSPFSNVSHSL